MQESVGHGLISRQVDVGGYPLVIFGHENDPYFSAIETHMPANKFLGAVMKHHAPHGAMFLDVGANIGVTSAMANAIIPDVRIVAVEPSARAFECLSATVSANMIKADLVRACVGKENGRAAFFEMDFLAGSHVIAADHPTLHNVQPTIPMVTLDTLVKEKGLEKLDLVKIDVEGFESDVLYGMDFIDETFKPLIFMEFNTFTITAYRNMSPRALLDQIRAKYGVIYYEEGDKLLRAADDGTYLALLHNTMTTGGVTDIMFTASPERRAALDAPPSA